MKHTIWKIHTWITLEFITKFHDSMRHSSRQADIYISVMFKHFQNLMTELNSTWFPQSW
jgi:hypothetical protein